MLASNCTRIIRTVHPFVDFCYNYKIACCSTIWHNIRNIPNFGHQDIKKEKCDTVNGVIARSQQCVCKTGGRHTTSLQLSGILGTNSIMQYSGVRRSLKLQHNVKTYIAKLQVNNSFICQIIFWYRRCMV